MKKLYSFYFDLQLLSFLLTISFSMSCPKVMAQTVSLNNLRSTIQIMQDSLTIYQTSKVKIDREFQKINVKIYNDKKKMKMGGNPLLRFRLNAKLKSSREITNTIEILDKKIQSLQMRLQQKYKAIIPAIDKQVENRLEFIRENKAKKEKINPELEQIRKLEKEKIVYTNQLQEIQVGKATWQNIKIEKNDSRQRIKMKLVILQDKLQNLGRFILQEKKRQIDLKRDRKVYDEMYGFYKELSRSIDDEMEFVDRNRIDELKDRVENISDKIHQSEMKLKGMKTNKIALEKIIRQFQAALVGNNN